VTQHLDYGGGDVGRPHGDGAGGVPEAEHGVVGVLAHHAAGAEAGAVLRDDGAVGGVLLFRLLGFFCGFIGVL